MSSDASVLIDTIVGNTYTVADLERRLGVLRGCVEAALFTETDLTYLEECAVYLNDEASEADAHTINEWGSSVLTAFTQTNVRPLLTELHRIAEQLPVQVIYLPCVFPDPELKLIADWYRGEVASRTLLDVHIDASVVGGCAVVARDTYHEFSFHTGVRDTQNLVTNLLNAYDRK